MPDIRVTFTTSEGYWSYVGTDARSYEQGEPTMCFEGWRASMVDDDPEEIRRVVLHEFGYALDCIHEHESPAAGIPWNKEAVYRHYTELPNKWSREEVDEQLFTRYRKGETNYSAYDPTSIMQYPVPKELTEGASRSGGTPSCLTVTRRSLRRSILIHRAPLRSGPDAETQIAHAPKSGPRGVTSGGRVG